MPLMCLHVQQEAESAKKKAYQLQVQRREEYEKARSASGRTEDEQSGGGRQRDKRRKLEEEALLKVGPRHWRLLGLWLLLLVLGKDTASLATSVQRLFSLLQ